MNEFLDPHENNSDLSAEVTSIRIDASLLLGALESSGRHYSDPANPDQQLLKSGADIELGDAEIIEFIPRGT